MIWDIILAFLKALVKAPVEETPPVWTEPQWLKLARAELGTAEIEGKQNNPKVVQYFKDAGHPEIVEDETAWCAAFVGAMLERSGIKSTKALNAQSYLNWGTKLSQPKNGCIVVIKRGSESWMGHVGFYLD